MTVLVGQTEGIINLLKPVGITSAGAVDGVRRITGVRKSGHAGTLDPAADGVLVMCLGAATKLVELVMNQPKWYRAVARLDATSASFDSEGPVAPVEVAAIPERAAVERALAGFQGVIMQTPPALSAVKIRGVPAYKLARRDQAVEIAARPVTIYWIALLGYEWPMVEFEMACGRGTYVRSVVRDLGLRLGTGGCLTALRRVAVGPFHVDQAWTFARLQTAAPAEYILPTAAARAMLQQAGQLREQRGIRQSEQ